MKLELQPIDFDEACAFIAQHHRHHLPPVGWKFGMAVNNGAVVVGVATVGRPVARHLQDGWTLEVTRCCTDGTRNAASMLYRACWQAAQGMGYKRLITYTLLSEDGASIKAAGYRSVYTTAGGSWHRKSRPRVDTAPTGQKQLWEIGTAAYVLCEE